MPDHDATEKYDPELHDTPEAPPEPTHQDPADPNEIGTEVETDDQPETPEEVEAPEPAEAPPTPVEPEPTPTQEPGQTANIHGDDYSVTQESGYRRT